MNVGHGIQLSSRRAESLMPFPVADRRATVPAYPSLVAAGADIPEADTPEAVAADPSVVDAERHPLYGHGVHSCDCLSRNLAALVSDPPHVQGHAASCPVRLAEYERLARLFRWQEQR